MDDKTQGKDARDKRDLLQKQLGSLEQERTSWEGQWKEISTKLLPRNGRFFTGERNKGTKRFNQIYDNTATRALRVLGAGFMGGATSPARPWLRMTTPDPDLADYKPVKIWLQDVTRALLDTFSRSNSYRALHSMYEELGAFGTAGSILMDDYENVIHHYPLTIGEYYLSADYRGTVDTLFRKFDTSVGGLVKEFGYANCSLRVQRLYDEGNYFQWVTVVHAIKPREGRDPRKRDASNMPYASCYFEQGGDQDKFLRESGMRYFRALTPRWHTVGGDVYGSTSPGMEALGDIKQLQHEQLRKGEGIDYQTKPPLQAPSNVKHIDRLPGGVTTYDSTGGPNTGIRSLWEVNLDLNHLLADIGDVRQRINGAFYTDMFLLLAGSNDKNKTATEVAELHEEKLLMLGPVMERLHNELLEPKIDITFNRLMEARGPGGVPIIPPPPPELQGQELNVEFVSILAQAQRAIGANGVDRFVTSLGAVATIKPEVLDKFDQDRWVDLYADQLGVDPELVVGNEQVALVRKGRAEQQQAAQQAALLQQGADSAQKLANADTSGKNALTDATAALTGYTTPGTV